MRGQGFHKPHLPFVVPQRHVDKYPIESISVASNSFAPVDLPRVAWSSYGELRSWGDIVDLDLPNTQSGYNKQNNSPNPNATFPDETARALRQHYFASVRPARSSLGEDAAKVNPHVWMNEWPELRCRGTARLSIAGVT